MFSCDHCGYLIGGEFRSKNFKTNNSLLIGNNYDELIKYAKDNNIKLNTFKKSNLKRKHKRAINRHKKYNSPRKLGNNKDCKCFR